MICADANTADVRRQTCDGMRVRDLPSIRYARRHEDRRALVQVRPVDLNLTVEAARPIEGGRFCLDGYPRCACGS